jgi:hypothetical protein
MVRWGDSGRPRTDAHQLGQHAHQEDADGATRGHALTDRQWVRDITADLSVAAIVEYLHLWDRLENAHLQPERDDALRWRVTPDVRYSSKSAYLAQHQGLPVYDGARLIWKSWAPLRVRLFMWVFFDEKHF